MKNLQQTSSLQNPPKLFISRNINQEFAERLTFGERLSDRIAAFGGSWRFILLFMGCLWAWVLLNSAILGSKAFDPYPYILLNLFLSMVAALQAPVIMMSQNRQSLKDRLAAEHDYEINVRSEQEIQQLQNKTDTLVTLCQQQQETIERLTSIVETLTSAQKPK